MTDCPNAEIRDRLPDLLHDALDGAARLSLESHLAACDACTRELALLRAARVVLSRAPSVDVARIAAALPRPAVAVGPRLVQFPTATERARRRGHRAPLRWAGVAAAAALAIAVGVSTHALRDRAFTDGATPTVATAPPSASRAEPIAARTGDREVAPAAPSAVRAASVPLLVVNTAGLSDADLAGLLDELDDLDAVPAADPLSLVPVAELPTGVGAGDGS